MANELRPRRRRRDGVPLIWFLLLSSALTGGAAVSGYWIKFPAREVKSDTEIELTNLDTNDIEKLGDPNVPEDTPPPEPEPTPPPPEDEPTPPPLDKPPEFEVPEPTPTPAPSATPRPSATPKPSASPKPKTDQPPPAKKPNPNAAATPGLAHGSATGAPDGTGHGGPRSGTLVRSPKPPYPPQALQMGIRGDVRVTFTVSNGEIVDAKAVSGPPMLTSAVIRWTKSNWKFAPGTNGSFTLPVSFQMQ